MKKVMVVAVAICLSVIGYRLYKAYLYSQPIAQAGECIAFEDKSLDKVRLYVLANDDKNNQSAVVIEIDDGFGNKQMYTTTSVSYRDLRDAGGVKVNCD